MILYTVNTFLTVGTHSKLTENQVSQVLKTKVLLLPQSDSTLHILFIFLIPTRERHPSMIETNMS